MILKFSRHAKRGGKLYKIPEAKIKEMLQTLDVEDGEHEIIRDISGFEFPIKVVIVVEDGIITVVTNYPLKKGKRNESLL